MSTKHTPIDSAPVWKVPRSRAHQFNAKIKEDILKAVQPALFGDYWNFPILMNKCEEKIEEVLGLENVTVVQSGSSALYLALKAAGTVPGDEIITVANSDMATTSTIINCGAVPVFCDVLASDYTMDPSLVESLITEKTRGILPVDLYGHPANIRKIGEIARKHGLFIVEDAALATASKDFGKAMGAYADLVCFSTCSTKQIGAIGNGGMTATADPALMKKLIMYRDCGTNPDSQNGLGIDQLVDGFNLRMSPVDAVVVTLKLDSLQGWTEKRKEIACWYQSRLKDCAAVTLPSFREESDPVLREFVIRVQERDKVLSALRKNGIQAVINYSPPAHTRKVYQDLNLRGSDNLPVTVKTSEETITLPVDPLLTQEEIDYVCDQILKAVGD